MEESIDQRDEQRKFNYWDIFRKDVSAQRVTRKSSLSDKIFKGLKLLVYVILFLLVFGGAIVSRAALQILTDQLYLERQTNYTVNLEKDAISYFLLFIISIPDGVKFIVSLMQFLFGKRQSPSCIQLIVVILKECLHFFCLGTIVFKLMPLLNAVEVCAYLSGIPLVPSFLHSISYRKKCFLGGRHIGKQMLNILSIILQAAALFAVPIYKVTNDQISSTDTFLMIFCAFCFSVRWFETYFKYSRESKLFKKLFAYEEREKTHAASSLVTSLFRLVLAVALFPTFFSPGVTNPVETFSSRPFSVLNSTVVPTPCLDISKNTTIQLLNTTILPCNLPSSKAFVDDWLLNPFLIHFFMSIGLFYGAIISTRLCMDKVCFCIALTFGTPVYVTGVFIAHIINEPNWISNTLMSKEVTDTGVYTMLVVFVIAWLSQLWTCRHIWYSSHDRMVFVSRLFVLPHYCSPVADLSLLHSRRHKSKHFEDRYQEDDSVKTKVYICATMWHENRIEMKQILKTLFRLDMDQAARSIAKNEVSLSASTESVFESGLDKKAVMRDYYEFEAHIMFDDAMETTQRKEGEGKKREPNEFVQQLMEIMSEAGMAVYQVPINLAPPDKLATPYGGRLVWTFPGENKLVVHLKDKEKIRHKKRWSQIMYLYYLIGYKLVNSEIQQMKEKVKEDFESVQSIFERLPANLVQQAENTYVMALDGDVDFSPEALQLLIDRMKKNTKVGATCGRIKPGGSGPVVWYQKFEYAIGHWLQKSAEHVFGCVLCSPGCFSLFRAKALMDDNVMRTYAKLPTEPKHYLQYDQGEDRWLCTLMLQQGYRIEYCAAAEALTFAPEEFREFFNQRRRWMPSTMANILDLLMSYTQTTRNNPNISYLYIFYQVILFLSSVLGPSTVLLAMQSAVRTVFSTSAVVAYIVTYAPTILFIFICLKFKSQTQLTIAMILSAIYAMLMMAVIVGTIVNISEEGFFTPSAVFMYVLVGVFLIAGLFHPHELTDLFWGVLYFICIPAGYLFLIIYAICNLNNVSWGTRETQTAVLENQVQKTQKKTTEDELGVVSGEVIEDILKQVKTSKIKDVSCRDLVPSIFQWINNLIILRSLESVVSIFKNVDGEEYDNAPLMQKSMRRKKRKESTEEDNAVDEDSWADQHGTIKRLKQDEINFWNELIVNYLAPLNQDKKKEKAVAESLKDFRNKVAFAFFFVNGLWLVIMTAMNEVKAVLNINIPTVDGSTITIEPLGLLFLVIFAILLFMQFFGMIRHRYGTFLQLLAATNLRSKDSDPESVIRKIKELSYSSEPDFVVHSNRKPGGKSYETNVSPEEIDDIYENFAHHKRAKNIGKSIKRPSPHVGNKPFDLKKTFRRNVNHMTRNNKEHKMRIVSDNEERL
ncbi:chitin synthase chs-2-like [Mytilus edulis]|uniref:chitin synthase chs-2-like n=1 Tax=Mytilus edulis TaxID=6550 RepID=UPI0039F003A9